MRSEAYKHWISIQQQSTVQDEAGQPQETWTEVVKLRAAINDLTGREFLAAQGEQAEVTTKIRIRYRNGIEADMRVVHGSVNYDIKAVLDQGGDKRELLLMCSK